MGAGDKAAAVYFSCSGNTERVAKAIAEKIGADLCKIEAKAPYSDDDLNWRDMNSRANREQNDASARPEIANIPDVSGYDTVYLGYPIWWGTLPKILNTFIETKVLDGKKIIAFCTSGSSGIETSVSALQNYDLSVASSQRFGSSASENEVEEWLEEL